MSSVIAPVYLTDAATGSPVEAQLLDRIEEKNLSDWEAKWHPMTEATWRRLKSEGVPRANWPQDLHWDWRKKLDDMRGLLSGVTFCIECDGHTQGMMAVNTARRARDGDHLVYIEYLEAAPWNRREHSAKIKFRGVGSILMYAAIGLSEDEEFKGRVGLHSLPQADQFYGKCGMTDHGMDTKYYNLRYFEMTTEQAQQFKKRKE